MTEVTIEELGVKVHSTPEKVIPNARLKLRPKTPKKNHVMITQSELLF